MNIDRLDDLNLPTAVRRMLTAAGAKTVSEAAHLDAEKLYRLRRVGHLTIRAWKQWLDERGIENSIVLRDDGVTRQASRKRKIGRRG